MIEVNSDATRKWTKLSRILFFPVKEFAKILNEADNHYDRRSRQAYEKSDFEQSHKEQHDGLHRIRILAPPA